MSFQDEVLPLLQRDVENLHNGDAGPRKQMWSHAEPVVLFGAAMGAVGWTEVEQVFDTIEKWFHGSRSLDIEVVAAESSGDIGYVCAIERSEILDPSGATKSYALRVTTVFRREDGTWKMVHRHGSPLDDRALDALASIR
ncbi:SnoaL-like domain-containing protein [Lentzea sp. NEAU-D13]|uniref:SnoaL-like domain-containing protein n=1 Tax=Lentzea alba TaxID=2714351 RepID=A0A7C9VZ66_9PSEU|nr:nuclear transport factor 2 family protein [Lentzea alba]NGY64456.1 SnoaL-like domain-containing protein [Lentzea alba]